MSCNGNSETSNWIAANTRECPKCHVTIEKDGGCNHMVRDRLHNSYCIPVFILKFNWALQYWPTNGLLPFWTGLQTAELQSRFLLGVFGPLGAARLIMVQLQSLWRRRREKGTGRAGEVESSSGQIPFLLQQVFPALILERHLCTFPDICSLLFLNSYFRRFLHDLGLRWGPSLSQMRVIFRLDTCWNNMDIK